MSKLIDIAVGWYHWIEGSTSTRERMRLRLAVCDKCSDKKETMGIFRCGLCNCPLGPMSAAPTPGCKAGKWK